MNAKVLLVELGDSHNEILFTQTEALRERGIPLGLFLEERLRARVHPAVLAGAPVEFHPCAGLAAQLRAALRIRALLRRERYTHVVVNTASGNAVRVLSLALPRAVRAVGVVHDVCKLTRSGTQRFISRRFKDYLVLADHLVPATPPPGLRVGAFYPIAFPERAVAAPGAAPAEDGPLRIVIPGNVSYARRDYPGLLALWKALPDGERRGLSIELLGNVDAGDGPDLVARLRREGLEEAFVLHRGFVPEERFYARLAAAHLVLPLLHPDTPDFEGYLRCKISGAFNLAYGFQKPLLMHTRFRAIPDFQRTAVFYDPPALPAVAALREAHARITSDLARAEALRPEHQQARYRAFVLT